VHTPRERSYLATQDTPTAIAGRPVRRRPQPRPAAPRPVNNDERWRLVIGGLLLGFVLGVAFMEARMSLPVLAVQAAGFAVQALIWISRRWRR
jgi:hypothetical protein